MKGVSKKEIDLISFLELHEKLFFTKADAKRFFRNKSDMAAYIHRLKKKGRIIKINRSKYYLIPIRAFKGSWSEHPFLVIDEIFYGKDYYIGGMAAAHHWGLIEQVPTQIEVFCTKKHGRKKIFNFTIIFHRVRQNRMKGFVKKRIKNHTFLIEEKKKVLKWLKSR